MRAAAAALGAMALLAAAAPVQAADLPSDGSSKALWTLRFASPQNDWINQILPLRDGAFLALGFLGREDGNDRSDWRALAVKFTGEGKVVWRKEYGAGAGRDAFWTAVEAPDGRIFATGFTDRVGSGGLDAWVAVLGADGDLMGETAAGGPGYDRATDIAPAADGGFVAAGFTTVEGRGRDFLLVKVDGQGREAWRRTIGGPKDDTALYIEPARGGGFIIAGGSDETGDGDVLMMQVDEEGREVWRRAVGEPGGVDVPHNLLVLADGAIMASGYTESWGSRGHDMLALTLSPDGEVLRHEVFGGPEDDRVMVSGLDPQGRVWLTGYTRSAGAGGWDVFLTRLGRDGGFEGGISTFGGPADDNGTAVLPLGDGTALVAAYTRSLDPDSGEDALVMRVSAPDWSKPAAGFRKRRIR
jgi:hypothetical protein